MFDLVAEKEWRSYNPVRELPKNIRGLFIEQALYLFSDLQHRLLRVILVSAPQPRFEGHKIRVVEETNPEWYSTLYNSHRHTKRQRCVRALDRILKLEDQPFKKCTNSLIPYDYWYDTYFRGLISDRLTNGYCLEGYGRQYFIPPREEAVEFFDMDQIIEINDAS